MNKKSLVFICFAILFLMIFPSMISAQEIPSGLSEEEIENLNKITVAANPQKWGELLESWKAGILENPIIFAVNNLFIQLNIVFLILFGVDYSMSLFMFFVIVFWVFFLISIASGLRMTSIFSDWVSMIISLGLTIVLAQLKLYSTISNLLFNNSFILNAKPFVGALIYLGIIILLVFLASLQKIIENKLKSNKELLEKEKEKLNRNILDTYVGGIRRGIND